MQQQIVLFNCVVFGGSSRPPIRLYLDNVPVAARLSQTIAYT